MFCPRTTSLNGVVWLLAAIQLLLQPMAGLLHSGCDTHSQSNVPAVDALSGAQAINIVWQRFACAQGCRHAEAKRSVVSHVISSARCGARHSCCCGKGHPEETNSKHPVDSGAPAHDSHECPICQVLFAARVNTVAIQLPDPTGWVLCMDTVAVPVAITAPRFGLPSRGPPSV
jgi:hypothetical protein